MSNFLSQLELIPQVDQNEDEEALENEDVEREKQIKELLANELNDDEFFDDDGSFASGSVFDANFDTTDQFYTFPKEIEHGSKPLISGQGALMTSRGSKFLNEKNANESWKQPNRAYSIAMDPGSFDEQNQLYNGYTNTLVTHYDKAGSSHITEIEKQKNDTQTLQYGLENEQKYFYNDFENRTKDNHEDDGRKNEDDYVMNSFHNHFSSNASDFSFERTKQKYGDFKSENKHISTHAHNTDTSQLNFPDNGQIETMSNVENANLVSLIKDHNQNSLDFHGNSQLKVLYEVRGKKIEELQTILKNVKEEKASELRVMQHKLALVTGERDGISTTLRQSENLFKEEREKTNQLELAFLEEQRRNKKLISDNVELTEKIEISESTIENLSTQLTSLNQNDSLSRMRSQHEALLSTLRQKHEEEILQLKEKLDANRKELNWKIEDVSRLQDELQESRKHANQIKVESAETVNRLSKALDQCQNQLKGFLEDGKLDEFGETKYLLKQAIKDKECIEAENRELKEEIKDAMEQLEMYGTALDGAGLGPSSSTPYTEGVDKAWDQFDSFKTPVTRVKKHGNHGDSPVYFIKNELVKALASNKSRREELKDARNRIIFLEKKLKNLEETKEDVNKKVDKSVMVEFEVTGEFLSEIQSKTENADEIIKHLNNQCDQLQNENAVLKSEISQMINSFDRDKIEALKNCERTYTQFTEDAKATLEASLKKIHNEELEVLRDEINEVKRELFDVKEAYVSLADENKNLEAQTRLECKRDWEQRLNEITNDLKEIHKEELHRQEERLLSENISQLEKERKHLMESLNSEANHRIETAVALAKVEWFATFENEKAKAVETAQLKIIREKESEAKELVNKMKEDSEREKKILKSERCTCLKSGVAGRKELEMVNSIINIISDELKIDLATDDYSIVILNAIQSLKQEANICERKMEKLRLENREFTNEVNEIKAKCSEDINNAISLAKNAWEKERNGLMQEVLKEESKRIRGELLLDFTENDNLAHTEKESEYVDDVYSDVRDFISYMKSVYCKKLHALKEKIEYQSNELKEEQENKESALKKASKEANECIAKVNEKWEKYIKVAEEEQERKYEERLKKELESAKNGWKEDLEELQKEHETVLRDVVKDMESKNDNEQVELKKKFNDYLRRIKKDYMDKIERQKIELENHHSDLTKKMLQVARKEWELQCIEKGGGTEYCNSICKESEERKEVHDDESELCVSDSGFTSPKLLSQLTTPKLHNGHEQSVSEKRPEQIFLKCKHGSTQTDHEDESTVALQYMRGYYLETVKNIKDDVFRHVRKTKENAAVCFRKQIAKEKKILLEKIRRKYIKHLKSNDMNHFGREKGDEMLQILKEIDKEEEANAAPLEHINEKEENHSLNSPNEKKTLVGIKNNELCDTNARFPNMDGDLNIIGRCLTKQLSVLNKKQISPSNSMFSCDSNGTFYTELPSSHTITPVSDAKH